jgi:hypothetical protein
VSRVGRRRYPTIGKTVGTMKLLPQYYDPSSALLDKTYKQTGTVTTKRQKWLRSKENENPKPKSGKTTIKQNKSIKKNGNQRKTIKELQEQTSIFNNNGNGKTYEYTNNIEVITIDSPLLNNAFVSDKKLFVNWINRTNKTKITKISKPPTITSNYYQCLENDNKHNNYTADNRNNKTTMPLLAPKPYTAPVFDTSTVNDEDIQHALENNDEGWTSVNQKEITREYKATTEFFSHIYLPRYIPQTLSTAEPINATSIVLPLSIKVLPSKDHRGKFKQSRILYAVLSIMQKVYKDTYLGPIVEEPTSKIIYNKKDVPLEITNLKEYMATPVHSKQSVFLGKIHIHTNHTLLEYQASDVFTEYLKKENIIIEINDLDDVNPVQLGFIENIIPRLDTINMHQNRLNAMMPPNTPKFQLHISSLWGKTGERCKVCMVKCDEANKEGFLQIFEKLHEHNIIKFFPMTDYTSCLPEQKTTIVKRINTWRAHFRSILIHGFCDNDNNVPMVYDNTNDQDNILTTTSVTDYMENYVKNSNGEKLFYYVYPPQFGIREVVVKLINYSQAASYAKIALGEIARNMDVAAIEKVFQDPTQACLDSTKLPWKPNSRVIDVIPTYTNNNKESKTKRQRNEPKENIPVNIMTRSYSSVTAATTISNTNNIPEMEEFKKSVRESVQMQIEEMKNSINNNKMELEGKMIVLDNNVKRSSEDTQKNLAIMRNEVEQQINEVKQEVYGTKTEMTEIKETLQSFTLLLTSMNEKMGIVTITTGTENANGKSLDVIMEEQKQQPGMRVTRSQGLKK